MELATRTAFEAAPDDAWAWYLYRRAACLRAEPNAAHHALARLEEALGDRFLLITQNVDGLHTRAGNSFARTFQIHGNIHFMRCSSECNLTPEALPQALPTTWERERPLTPSERDLLCCRACGSRTRPHVLWFDEYYDEPLFRFESSLAAAADAELLVVVGTTGSTNLPLQIGGAAARHGTPLVVVNPESNPFSETVERGGKGIFLEGTAGRWIPEIVARLGG
jgi:NAD-dependent deacetylase